MLSLARICSITMFVYLFMLILVFLHSKGFNYINSPWGYWYLVEVVGFVLIPCLIFLLGYKRFNLTLIRFAAVISIVGIILNRMNISTFTYQWYDKSIHFPTWMEIVVSCAVIFVQLLVFRWIVRRMPVYTEPPAWASEEKKEQIAYN